MTITNTAAWDALPMDTRVMFYDIASKEGSTMTGAEWFYHLVPEQLQDNHEHVEVFMNGGTVTQEVWIHDQGMANGHYEQVEYEISDKDVSRIQSGENGGDYTADNTVMEDASANRSRQADDMTSDELDNIQEANAMEAELIDGSEVMSEASSTATSGFAAPLSTDTTSVTDVGEVVSSSAEAADGLLDYALEGVLPLTYGAKAAQAVWDSTEDMETGERVAVAALGGGTAVLGTYTALAFVPGLNLVLGGIALYKVGTAVHKWATTEPTKQKAAGNGQAIFL